VNPDPASTQGTDYTDRLQRLEGARWKRWLNVQAPYRWNLRRLKLGRTLDVGCGIGRNLAHLGGNGVGVDHNPASVAVARSRGLEAYTTDEFFASRDSKPGSFDSLLAAHLAEHMDEATGLDVLRQYLPCVKPGGTVVLITPQERGFASDPTHVRPVGYAQARVMCEQLGLRVERQYSFPLPRLFGRMFTHNEFVTVARKP
jgi:SAM-dependent methyltransferase